LFQQLLPHAHAAADWQVAESTDAEDAARVVNQIGIYLWRRGVYQEAELVQCRALAICEASLGPEHPDVAASLNNLADVLQAQGRDGEAEPLYRRALAIREATLGPEHPEVAG